MAFYGFILYLALHGGHSYLTFHGFGQSRPHDLKLCQLAKIKKKHRLNKTLMNNLSFKNWSLINDFLMKIFNFLNAGLFVFFMFSFHFITVVLCFKVSLFIVL